MPYYIDGGKPPAFLPGIPKKKQRTDDQISDIYGNAQKAQQDKIDASYAMQKADFNAQQQKAASSFQGLTGQAHVDNAMAEQKRKEAMANMGFSGGGGTSQTVQQSNTNALNSTLGDIGRQKQDYSDNVNLALSKLGTQYNSDTNSLAAQTQSDMGKAQLEQSNFQKQFNLSKSQVTFDQAWALYKSGRISKKTFNGMTNMNI